MLSNVVGELPEALRSLVVERAEGNPLFVEELLEALIDQGVLDRTSSGWTVRDVPQGALPDSLNALLAARIDLLETVEKDALQAAAVIGRTFWEGAVRELANGEEPDFGVLEERDFVRRRPGSTLPDEREYVIKHALTRDVAYGAIPKPSGHGYMLRSQNGSSGRPQGGRARSDSRASLRRVRSIRGHRPGLAARRR